MSEFLCNHNEFIHLITFRPASIRAITFSSNSNQFAVVFLIFFCLSTNTQSSTYPLTRVCGSFRVIDSWHFSISFESNNNKTKQNYYYAKSIKAICSQLVCFQHFWHTRRVANKWSLSNMNFKVRVAIDEWSNFTAINNTTTQLRFASE